MCQCVSKTNSRQQQEDDRALRTTYVDEHVAALHGDGLERFALVRVRELHKPLLPLPHCGGHLGTTIRKCEVIYGYHADSSDERVDRLLLVKLVIAVLVRNVAATALLHLVVDLFLVQLGFVAEN